MSKQNKDKQISKEPQIESPQNLLITKVSDVVSKGVGRLPNSSGDLLNYMADLIAVLLLGWGWYLEAITDELAIISFGMVLAYILICFMGTLLMRLVRGSEKLD
jgi:hypothetical protein